MPFLFSGNVPNGLVSSVGALYIWSAEQIKKGAPNGIEGALGKALYHY